MDAELADELGGGDLGVDLRSDAVPRHVPAGRVVADEGELFLAAKARPDPLGVGSQLVDDDGGIGAEFAKPGPMELDEGNEPLQTEGGEIDPGRGEVGIVDSAEVGVGKPAMPRDGIDAALPAEGTQGHDGIDGGESGAEDDDPTAVWG